MIENLVVYMDWDGSNYGANGRYAFFSLEKNMVHVKKVTYGNKRYTLPDTVPILGYNLKTGDVNWYGDRKDKDTLNRLMNILRSMEVISETAEETQK